MSAITTALGYGDGIIHPVTRLSSPQQHTMTLLHSQIPQSSHPARNPRRRDIVATPFAARIDAVFAVKKDDINTPSQLLSTLPRANRNRASNGFSNKLKSSRQTSLRNDDESSLSTIHEQINLYLSATALILDAALRDLEHDRKRQHLLLPPDRHDTADTAPPHQQTDSTLPNLHADRITIPQR
jgi:hypothetical protein